ncbi:hypothetical protein ACN4EG_26640, partial [Alkalinema pantanalense CENA528]
IAPPPRKELPPAPPRDNPPPSVDSGSAPPPKTPPAPPPAPPSVPTPKPPEFIDKSLAKPGVLSQFDRVANNRYYHVYFYDGKAKEPIQIRLVGSNDKRLGLTPSLFLFDPDGGVIGKRFGEGNNSKSAFMFNRLPKDGIYAIVVTSRAEKDIGRYSLVVRDDRTNYLLDKEGSLNDKSPRFTDSKRPFAAYEFTGKKGQIVNIRVDTPSADFIPLVYLVNAKGELINTYSDKDKLYRVQIERAELPSDETYFIVVTSLYPAGRGKYRVSLY